jgi:hypothetical protein
MIGCSLENLWLLFQSRRSEQSWNTSGFHGQILAAAYIENIFFCGLQHKVEQ